MLKMAATVGLLLGACSATVVSADEQLANAVDEPPRLRRDGQEDLNSCYPSEARARGLEGRVIISVIVQPDGTASDLEFPAGAEPWQQESAYCVIKQLRFNPGKRGGAPVPARVTLPIVLSQSRGGGSIPILDFGIPEIDSGGAGTSAIEDSEPIRMIGTIGEASKECRRTLDAKYQIGGTVEAEISIDARGQPSSVIIPDETEAPLAQLARCTAIKLRFEPMDDGAGSRREPVRLTLDFPIPPVIKSYDISYSERCSRRTLDYYNAVARFVIEITVAEDGSVMGHRLPPDAEPWMAKVAKCVVDALEFTPARARGKPVQATAMMPIITGGDNIVRGLKDIARPKPMSSDADILAAYRNCYPEGQTGEQTIGYRITVSTQGDVLKAELLQSSGNALFDEAGACILKRLKFEPASLNGIPLQATVGWPILVRPPPAGP
jgi:TonB family protein